MTAKGRRICPQGLSGQFAYLGSPVVQQLVEKVLEGRPRPTARSGGATGGSANGRRRLQVRLHAEVRILLVNEAAATQLQDGLQGVIAERRCGKLQGRSLLRPVAGASCR